MIHAFPKIQRKEFVKIGSSLIKENEKEIKKPMRIYQKETKDNDRNLLGQNEIESCLNWFFSSLISWKLQIYDPLVLSL